MGGDKKTEEQLREEIAEKFNWNLDENQDEINKVLEIEKDKYSAIQSKKRLKENYEKLFKGKEFYKAQAKTVKKDPNKGNSLISSDDKAYLYSQGRTRTEIRHLEKVMKSTGKDWGKALNDNLYKTWELENDKLIVRRGSVLGASKGGKRERVDSEHQATVKKFADKLGWKPKDK